MDSLIEVARRPFLDLAPELAGALVLLDAGAAEVVQLSLGPAFLLGELVGGLSQGLFLLRIIQVMARAGGGW